METVQIIAVVAACLLGWLVVSLGAALVLGRLIAHAKSEQREEREWQRQQALTPPGVPPVASAPPRATLR